MLTRPPAIDIAFRAGNASKARQPEKSIRQQSYNMIEQTR